MEIGGTIRSRPLANSNAAPTLGECLLTGTQLKWKAPAFAHCVGYRSGNHQSCRACRPLGTKVIAACGVSGMGIAILGCWGKSHASAAGSARRSERSDEDEKMSGVGGKGGVARHSGDDNKVVLDSLRRCKQARTDGDADDGLGQLPLIVHARITGAHETPELRILPVERLLDLL